jgi:hypothetical protein
MASCGGPSGDPANSQQGAPQPEAATTFSPSAPQPLQLTVVTKQLANGLRVEGRTNLPDGTQLMLRLQRGPVFGGDKEFVQNGRFQEDIYPKDGKPIPSGSYDVEVSTPLGDIQPANIKEQLGSDYEALTGPFLVKDEVSGGRIIDYTTKAHIGGAVDPRADEEARKAAYREHEAYSEKACRSNPDAVEHLTGTPMTAEQRANSIRKCLNTMAQSREELEREGLVQR